MSIMLFVILLHLLVARATNTRVESPPRLVLLTGRRYTDMSPASHTASKSSPTPPARGVGLTSGGWALLPGVRGAKAGRNPVEMVMKLRFEPVPTLDGMTIEEIIRLKEDHAALKLKLESERSEVESLLRAVRQYEATAGKFLSSPSMLSVLSSASLTTTLTVGTQGWRARSSAAAHSP